MKEIVQKSFENVVVEYKSFFEEFYPGKKSAGFNEVNQVAKFLHHYKSENNESLVWLELSFGGSDGRMDGFVIDKQRDAAIFIEAKRLSDPRKRESISGDLVRACTYKNRKTLLEDNNNGELLLHNNHYVLILVDIWNESNDKHNWINDWIKDNPINSPANAEIVAHYISEPLIGNYHLAYSLYKINNMP